MCYIFKPMKLSLTKILIVNFLVFLISITIIEIFFGYWFSAENFGPYMREHRLKKNSVYLNYNNQTYHFIYKRNYHGFRGENLDPSKIQAVIIGGSTADERYKPEEFTITENLNTLLQEKDYNFKIINAGIEGQSTVGHIYNFEHWFFSNCYRRFCWFKRDGVDATHQSLSCGDFGSYPGARIGVGWPLRARKNS